MVRHKLASVLRTIGSLAWLEMVKDFETKGLSSKTINLRSLGLTPHDIKAITSVLNTESDINSIASISFIYNRLISDRGAITLAKNLPISLSEIG